MLRLKVPRTYARRSLRRALGWWPNRTCCQRSLHGLPPMINTPAKAFPMVSLLILLIVLSVALTVLLLQPTSRRSYGVVGPCMDGSLRYMGSSELRCNVGLK